MTLYINEVSLHIKHITLICNYDFIINLNNYVPKGALNRVDSLVGRFPTLSCNWKAPFSLDLTNIEPDIVYCVDVYNITCGGRELLISDCDVEGAVNGTPSQPLRGKIILKLIFVSYTIYTEILSTPQSNVQSCSSIHFMTFHL